MSAFEKIKERFKQFKPTSWVVDHKTVTYVATIVITLWGLNIFTTLPKESYPDIVLPQIYVSTIYAGYFSKGYGEPGYTANRKTNQGDHRGQDYARSKALPSRITAA